MISKKNKNLDREGRHKSIRKILSGTAEAPRLNVYRSLNHIYTQLIDDVKGVTLVAASTMEKEVAVLVEGKNKVEAAKIVGAEIAKRAIAKGIKAAKFDRGGYLYIGRVQAVADGAREAGLEF